MTREAQEEGRRNRDAAAGKPQSPAESEAPSEGSAPDSDDPETTGTGETGETGVKALDLDPGEATG